MTHLSQALIEIKNLHANVENKPILKGLNLVVQPGEIHAIMGPNGAGKSTLAKVLAGHPAYEITSGEILFKGQNIVELAPEDRAHAGIFMSFQYPLEIPGVSNLQFLHASYNSVLKAKGNPEMPLVEFEKSLDEMMKRMEIKTEFKERSLNEGFSGGEKKRNEILQMAVLQPALAILDETDSGLDIDAMRIVARGVNQLMNPQMGLILITHYQRLLDYIKPNVVHVMVGGKIVQSGGPELAHQLEDKGYDWLVPAPQSEALR
ncbi:MULTISPECIES: Fe-S cluster assembly ATPase SufC [unclassified Neochlamydia]|uniref:Fe-S cluster assembly ATPase SufC n=1 Tax=unclassified Neochlamydia TaxID=2643326 RepID=UPI001BC95233|nr:MULTISPECIES: Fe-S cluster assembly ATPase SufC [unclassified Neochlamydia]MBS4165675.1 putative ATP-dependent transporter ycf16 [Neochlamydia sp. AcF65]MBS4171214.1 putative ATP-dependent transporter ycf16 [Neochlamydia sp. AcF95]